MKMDRSAQVVQLVSGRSGIKIYMLQQLNWLYDLALPVTGCVELSKPYPLFGTSFLICNASVKGSG